ncbi:MAG: hypothetical protein LBS01_04980 [Prevotellaceae bacterium]|jgi:hypothetical protein|nr:hypothetical protein [Prevotellaceae bacterium]
MARNTTKYRRNKKVDVEDRVKQALVTVVTGAGLNLVEGLVGDSLAGDILSYVELGVGIAAPIIVEGPGIERAGDALAAVAAYKVGENLGLRTMFGGTTSDDPVVIGYQDNLAIGNSYFPAVKNNFQRKFEARKATSNAAKTLS